MDSLVCIPLVIAGWLRYLEAKTDSGEDFTPSPDPMLEELQGKLAAGGIELCVTDAVAIHNAVRPILSNKEIFDCDLYEAGLGERVEAMFAELNEGPGAVRATLKKYLTA